MTEIDLKRKCKDYYDYFSMQNYNFGINIYHLFYIMCKEVKNNLVIYENIDNDNNIQDFKKIDFFNKIDLSKTFFEKINLNVDIEKAVNDGTIDCYETNFDLNNIKSYLNGHVRGFDNNNFDVLFPNSGLALDLIIMLHELGHYTNKPNNEKDISILSEGIALYTELQSYDYLSELGYKSEVDFHKKFRMKKIYKDVVKYCDILPYFLTYINFGDLTKENFEKLFNDKDYYETINNIEYKDELFFSLLDMRYIFGILLATYMYEKVKEDFSFTENINKFNKNLTKVRFDESLKEIGIENLDRYSIEMLSMSMKNFINKDTYSKRI